MSATAPATKPAPDHHAQFIELLQTSLEQNGFIKLVLAKYVGEEAELQRVVIKPVTVKAQPNLSFVYRYKTRDITKNLPLVEGVAAIAELLPASFKNAHLLAVTDEAQLEYSKKGKSSLFKSKPQQLREAPSAEHNREKNRFLELSRPFLKDLGVTNAQQELIPAMSRKWKQINKFIEVFSHALTSSPLALDKPVRVADFGSGKGYLTFAIHDYLRNTLKAERRSHRRRAARRDGQPVQRRRRDRLDHPGLVFKCGDVRSVAPSELDVMIALHACDIATDYAIHTGIRSGASIIMCSPCCHKQIRLQIQSPALLKPMLQYGLHLGQQAEMVTDSLRALLLEACGYETKVFEFISLEHTNKNKMILAVKRAEPMDPAQLLVKIQELKDFYNISEHCLETLLRADGFLA
jgi:hypothetical protein